MQRQSSTATQITSNVHEPRQSSSSSSSTFRYGRVSYKGVVALLNHEDLSVPSGGYVAYGDILELHAATATNDDDDDEYYHIRSVLTGGYAVPPQNLWGSIPAHVVALVPAPPRVERNGDWYYKVISTTPVPILTGPMTDAPPTKAVALPGTVQAIATRFHDDSEHQIVWLQLQHRRGWMADRHTNNGTTIVVQETTMPGEFTGGISAGGASRSSSGDGGACNSVVTRSTRHRPPRRRRDTALPRHVKEEAPPIPSSNVSILSDDSFHAAFPTSPASSLANTSTSRTTATTTTTVPPILSLLRVTATRGLTILDAPHWQVQHHFRNTATPRRPTSTACCSHIIYDGKTRRLPRGAFCSTTATAPEPGYDGAQLLQLADQSGWLVIPQSSTNSYVTVGSADRRGDVQWLRVTARSGIPIVCANNSMETNTMGSPRSDVGSTASSAWDNPTTRMALRSTQHRVWETESMASSSRSTGDTSHGSSSTTGTHVIACGMCVPVQAAANEQQQEYARLQDGQGWIPLFTTSSSSIAPVPTTLPLTAPPTVHHGSFWFRVTCTSHRLKVRTGPSSRAPSLKSATDDPVRFCCGEHVRASAVLTLDTGEAWCQLYRHRHTQERDSVQWAITPAEWVQLQSSDGRNLLEPCDRPPVMERHRQGWRYQITTSIDIRQGPSEQAAPTGVVLLPGETVVINERVTSHNATWLRCKDGSGWVPYVEGQLVLLLTGPQRKAQAQQQQQQPPAGYSTIMARLFPSDETTTTTSGNRTAPS